MRKLFTLQIYTKNIYLYSFLILFVVIALFFSCNNNSPHDFYYTGHYPPIKTITITKNGQDYNIEAISGHVIVIFKPTISHVQAVRYIKNNFGMIIGQTVDIRYYLVYVGSGNESAFINRIKDHPDIKFVFLNAVDYPCNATPKTAVFDNFYISHGNTVTYVLQECGLKTGIDRYNVGIKGNERGGMSWGEIGQDLSALLKQTPNDTPVVINMSFGPSFTDRAINLWTDKRITDDLKRDYKVNYKAGIEYLIDVVSNYTDKDFVIVKAAGNEGLKQLDIEILNDFRKELSPKDFDILNKHFILVGAEDIRDSEYSNTVTTGRYNSLYTAVSISDLKQNGQDIDGTSVAAPRLACYISSTINENNIKATDALKAVKDITFKNPNKSITQSTLNQEAKRISANRQPATNENNTRTTQKTSDINRTNQPNNLAGTKWEYKFSSSYFYSYVILEFDNGFHVTEKFYDTDNKIKHNNLYKYYYHTEKKSLIMYNTPPPDSIFSPGEYYKEPKLSATDDNFNLFYSLLVSGNKLIVSNTRGFRREFNRFSGTITSSRNTNENKTRTTHSTTENLVTPKQNTNTRSTNNSGQTWDVPGFWGTETYTVITKSQFDSKIAEGVRSYLNIGIGYHASIYGTLPRNALNLNKPYYLLHTWKVYRHDIWDLETFAPKAKLSLYYIGNEGGIHIQFVDKVTLLNPSTWFRTNSWSREYLELLTTKSNGTDSKIDGKIDKLYADLYKRGQIVN